MKAGFYDLYLHSLLQPLVEVRYYKVSQRPLRKKDGMDGRTVILHIR